MNNKQYTVAIPTVDQVYLNHQLFFEGVEGLMASGTRADQVGFQLDYSKNELRKCIKEYPGKEVRKYLILACFIFLLGKERARKTLPQSRERSL